MIVTVRLWKRTDTNYVADSVEQARWGYTKSDVERCWRCEPNGCFIAEVSHEPVGHVFSINYGKMGWIGLLIVKEEHRQRGIGTLLTRTAMDYLRNAGADTIRLEAVERAVPLYQRLGFVEEFDSLRFSKQLKQGEGFASSIQTTIVGMEEEDLDAVARFDSRYFGANRLRVLNSLYRESPQLCFVARKKNLVAGYIMGRKIPNAYRIGPWVCTNEHQQVASNLLFACINAMDSIETEVRIGAPAPNKAGTKLMEKLGFKLVSKSVRMVWGKRKHQGDVNGVYGIGGPEKG